MSPPVSPEDKTGRPGGAKTDAAAESGGHPRTLSFFRRRRTRTAFLCAAFLVLGTGLGSLVTCVIIGRHMRRGFRDPDKIASHVLPRIRDELDLTDEQAERILPVLKKRFGAVNDAIRREYDLMNEEIGQFLDEEQLARHRKTVARMRERFFGPHSGNRGGKR